MIKIELKVPAGLKIYNGVLVGCVFESILWHFWLIWGCAV